MNVRQGHDYQRKVYDRTHKGFGCPYCPNKKVLSGFNDIATTNPELLKEWDYEKNDVSPTELSRGSGKKVWFKCKVGHSYQTTVPNKLKGCGCTFCNSRNVLKGFNDIGTTDPHMLKVWDDNHYSPFELSRKSSRTISCKCPSCGHRWTTKVHNLTNQRKCPGCKKDLLDL